MIYTNHQPQDPEQQLRLLEGWFESERGQKILKRETELIGPALSQAFGYYLLQLSVNPSTQLFQQSRVQRNFHAYPFGNRADVFCDHQQLPFANECLDVVVLHHVQEIAPDPYQLLREVQRVVVPKGQVMIFGFNPWSPFGIYSRLHSFRANSPWKNSLISCWRMKDWLGVLGFETTQVDFGMTAPDKIPQGSGAVVDSVCRRWPFGSFYLISAVKHVASITPVRPKWKSQSHGFSGLSPIKSRSLNCDGYRPLIDEAASNRSRKSLRNVA